MQTRTWGIELELGNIKNMHKRWYSEEFQEFRNKGWSLNEKELSMINKITINNQVFYIPTDPNRKLYDIGGEINSPPYHDYKELIKDLWEILYTFGVTNDNLNASLYNCHIHVSWDGIENDYVHLLRRLIDQHEDLYLWHLQYFIFKTQRRESFKLKSRFYKSHLERTYQNLQGLKSKDPIEWLHHVCCNDRFKDRTWAEWYHMPEKEKRVWHILKTYYIRPFINVVQLLETKTIEFRYFHLLGHITELETKLGYAFKCVETILDNYDKGFTKQQYEDLQKWTWYMVGENRLEFPIDEDVYYDGGYSLLAKYRKYGKAKFMKELDSLGLSIELINEFINRKE